MREKTFILVVLIFLFNNVQEPNRIGGCGGWKSHISCAFKKISSTVTSFLMQILSKEQIEIINEYFQTDLDHAKASEYRAAMVIWNLWKNKPDTLPEPDHEGPDKDNS